MNASKVVLSYILQIREENNIVLLILIYRLLFRIRIHVSDDFRGARRLAGCGNFETKH